MAELTKPIDDGGPAFPEPGLSGLPNDQFVYGREGMTLRDWFAGKTLSSLILPPGAWCDVQMAYDRMAEHSYTMADAMLRARSKGGAA